MRPIKFRAWHKKEKEMWDWRYLLGTMVGGTGQNAFGRCDLEIMQFTGLHDKNGKEIYEGDLVHQFGGLNHIVKFADCAFRAGEYVLNEIHQSEIIGNIYENPELLINN